MAAAWFARCCSRSQSCHIEEAEEISVLRMFPLPPWPAGRVSTHWGGHQLWLYWSSIGQEYDANLTNILHQLDNSLTVLNFPTKPMLVQLALRPRGISEPTKHMVLEGTQFYSPSQQQLHRPLVLCSSSCSFSRRLGLPLTPHLPLFLLSFSARAAPHPSHLPHIRPRGAHPLLHHRPRRPSLLLHHCLRASPLRSFFPCYTSSSPSLPSPHHDRSGAQFWQKLKKKKKSQDIPDRELGGGRKLPRASAPLLSSANRGCLHCLDT
jgi:hypothetical protein